MSEAGTLTRLKEKFSEVTNSQKLIGFMIAAPAARQTFKSTGEGVFLLTHNPGLSMAAGALGAVAMLAAAFCTTSIGLSQIYNPEKKHNETQTTGVSVPTELNP